MRKFPIRSIKNVWKIIKIFLLILIILLLFTAYKIGRYNYKSTHYSYNIKLDVELEYWNVKSQLVDEIEEYIESKAPYNNLSALLLLNCCEEFDIDVRLPLAQGQLESHYGTKGLAQKTNSVWNMGAFDGKNIDKILGIYKYAHPNQSIRPYLKNLKENYLSNKKTEEDLLKNFVNLDGKRYASYDKYEQELQLTWNNINTVTKLDSLLQVYRHLKIELGR